MEDQYEEDFSMENQYGSSIWKFNMRGQYGGSKRRGKFHST